MGEWDAYPLAEAAPTRITVRPSDAGWDKYPLAQPPSDVGDFFQSIPGGVAKGVAATVGLPERIGNLWQQGADTALDFVSKKLGLPPEAIQEMKAAIAKGRTQSAMGGLPSTEQAQGAIESVTGKFHEPQTRGGRYGETIGEMIPTAGRRLITQAAIPGVASEAAGEVTKGTALEPWARAGAAITTGGVGAAVTRPRSAEQAIRQQLPQGVDQQTIARAEALIADARTRGVSLTWPEAIEQVAPGQGQGLLNTQRILESSKDTRAELAPFFAERPGQIDRAARSEFDRVAPATAEPSTIGPRVGGAATEELEGVRRTINDVAEPHYRAAEGVRLTPQEMQRVRALPGYQEARDLVRNTPQLNRYVAHLPEDSVGFLNEVKKQLDIAGENATRAINPNQNHQIAAGLSRDATAVRDVGRRASPDYATALDIESFGRGQILDQLMQTPIGKLAERNLPTKRAIEVLFPANPVPGSAQEVGRAVAAVNRQSPGVAAQLVRAHAEATFNEAAQNLKAGAAQAGGAKYAAAIVGNPQQRANLQAAVEALPNGAQTWAGFNRFLEIAAATGKRQDIGSRTAFNTSDLKDLSSGRMMSEGSKAAVSPQRLITVLGDSWDRWQLGRNLGELSRILTDPQSGRLLRSIAQRPQGAREAQILAARLTLMFNTTTRHEPGQPSAKSN